MLRGSGFIGVLIFGAICSFNASIMLIDFEVGFCVCIIVGVKSETLKIPFLPESWSHIIAR